MSEHREPGQSIKIASVPNLRDLGGWPTRDGGTVRYGLLYRSTDLTNLAGADMEAFAALGIRSVYDLRTEPERVAQPDRVPPGTEQVTLDVCKDLKDSAPAELLNVMSDPKAAQAVLGDGRGLAFFEEGYREIVTLSSACSSYHRLFSDLTSAEHRPALFHCTTGKDRTGWAAAAMLMLLGVPDDLVMKEYLLTNTQLLPAEKSNIDRFKAEGGDPELLRPVVGVAPEYLNAALEQMRKDYGTIEGYFSDGLKLDENVQATLREVFIEPSGA